MHPPLAKKEGGGGGEAEKIIWLKGLGFKSYQGGWILRGAGGS